MRRHWYGLRWLQPVVVIDNTKEAADKFGWNYGGQVNYITKEQVDELLAGKLVAIDVNGGEYTQFITLDPKELLVENSMSEAISKGELGDSNTHSEIAS